jgi:hypothetical protein
VVTYDDLCTAIIQKKIVGLGRAVALKAARDVGITVDDNGTTKFTDRVLLGKLVDSYLQVSGRVGLVFMRSAVAALVKGQNIELPDNLK